jgi:hypothetical protein
MEIDAEIYFFCGDFCGISGAAGFAPGFIACDELSQLKGAPKASSRQSAELRKQFGQQAFSKVLGADRENRASIPIPIAEMLHHIIVVRIARDVVRARNNVEQ